jgi:hypothetical protein
MLQSCGFGNTAPRSSSNAADNHRLHQRTGDRRCRSRARVPTAGSCSRSRETPLDQTHRFRVKKERRQHLHQQIEAHSLDMTHVTDRNGSPQTLVCTKDRRSYQHRCDQYRKDNAALGHLAERAKKSSAGNPVMLKHLAAARTLAEKWVHQPIRNETVMQPVRARVNETKPARDWRGAWLSHSPMLGTASERPSNKCAVGIQITDGFFVRHISDVSSSSLGYYQWFFIRHIDDPASVSHPTFQRTSFRCLLQLFSAPRF